MRDFTRDHEPTLDIPVDACLHTTLLVRKAESKKSFIEKLTTRHRVHLPASLLSFSLFLGWNEDAFYVAVEMMGKPPYASLWPKYRSGDAFEVFIDTRNMRSFRLLHRYCHQFIVFPEAVEGIVSREITEFRTQETRALALDNTVKVGMHEKKERGCHMPLLIAEIPQDALFGWEPEEGSKVGFGCSLYSEKNTSHVLSFPITSRDSRGAVLLERFPYRWATCILKS